MTNTNTAIDFSDAISKLTKPELIDLGVERGWLKNKNEGKSILKNALVTLFLARHDEEAPSEPEKAPEPVAAPEPLASPLDVLKAPRAPAPAKNTKPPLTKAQRDAKRKRNKMKHRRELGRRRH